MSIQYMSAVLDCRDTSLEAAKRMVLIAIANYAGDDGKAWPSQERIAADSGIAVRTCKRHIKWLEDNGFLSRYTKHLGQGNGSRTTYRVHIARLSETAADTSGQDEINKGAKFARANPVTWEGHDRPLTNRHEPSVTTSNDVVAREQKKPVSRPRGASRATRIPDNWTPTPKDYAFATSKGLTPQEINNEVDRFRDYWTAAGGAKARKRDWEATWRNWITSDFGPLSKRRQPPHKPNGGGGLAGQFARFADQMGGAETRSQAWDGYDPARDEGVIIDAQPIAGNW